MSNILAIRTIYETVSKGYLDKTNWLVDKMPFCGQKGQQLQDYLGASIDTVKVSDINSLPDIS